MIRTSSVIQIVWDAYICVHLCSSVVKKLFYKQELDTLLILSFQTFDKVQIAAR
jgi:hypothetical protein